jgi:chromosome segregation ATPase
MDSGSCKTLGTLSGENHALRIELEHLTEHEKQTHESLGAILGTDTSLEDAARRMSAELERVKGEYVECRSHYDELLTQYDALVFSAHIIQADLAASQQQVAEIAEHRDMAPIPSCQCFICQSALSKLILEDRVKELEQQNEKMQLLINEAEGRCLAAVEHIDAANYDERLTTAKKAVRQVFSELIAALQEKS